jgi:heme-degrading monooxygenase HmoA
MKFMKTGLVIFGLVISGIVLLMTACDKDNNDRITDVVDVNRTVVEVASAELRDGVSDAEFAQVCETFQKNFVNRQPGFIQRVVMKNAETGRWTTLVFWESMDAAQAAFASAPTDSDFQTFFSYYKPETTTIRWDTIYGVWAK